MEPTSHWDDYIHGYVIPARTEQVKAMLRDYLQHKDEIAQELVYIIDRICLDTLQRQEEGKIQACALLRISLLRSSLLENTMTYVLETLDDEGIQSEQTFSLTPFRYEATWIYNHLRQWESLCQLELKRYIGAIRPWSLDSWIQQEMAPFQDYMVHAVRYATTQIQELVSYQAMTKAATFEIVVGQYGDATLGESVYFMSERQKSDEDTKKWLQRGATEEYIYSHILGVDISSGEYGASEWNYLRVEQVNLSQSNLRESVLVGTKFEQCNCQFCDFTGSMLYDADFRGCDLEGACFDYAIGEKEQVNVTESMIFGIYGVQFQGANLKYASFREAKIAGDFRYADLHRVDFTGADLTGSIMLLQDGMHLNLTEAQILQVAWLEE